ncbi:MAG: imidazole glycerol phosphate synthase subunit HisH [Coriobacteriia bacterium]|nr:imidazole glycerol phosphate synthase subunit HisH [Coriobacteriia bacterium]
MARICIIDYQRGNLASVRRGLADAGYDAFVSDRVEDILTADGLVLPGVGSFGDAMGILDESGQADAIRTAVAAGTPFLGICLGQQLIYERGNEGCDEGQFIAGLGLVPGEVVRMPAFDDDGVKYKVPHVGWNSVKIKGENPLFAGIEDESYFYFTHSYIGVPSDPDNIAGVTTHAQPFACAVRRGNVFATQFHPEKSSTKGLRMLANFGQMVQDHAAAKEA